MTDRPKATLPSTLEESLSRDLRAFDWDGQIIPLIAEIEPIVAPHYLAVCRTFWEHYLAHPETAPIRAQLTADMLEQEIASGAVYMRAKFEDPLGRAWMEMACHNAKIADRAGVSLAPQLSALTASHQQTLETDVGDVDDRLRGLKTAADEFSASVAA